MNIFEKVLYFLQGEMNEPPAFGLFHLMWLFLGLVTIYILYKNKKRFSEKQLKIVLGVYSIVAIILEFLKQLIWAFNYDPITNIITWDYEWYAFPFQLCTTPMYVSLMCLFLKKCKLRDSLLSYISYITILGSVATIILPDNCLTSDILVNIHTMWLHIGSFVVSVYLLMMGEVKIEFSYFKKSCLVFLFFTGIALLMNIFVYNIGVLNGKEFNMFYISPYFISELPVFDIIQSKLPYIPYLIIYICALMLGGLIIYGIAKIIKSITAHHQINNDKENKKNTLSNKEISQNIQNLVLENRTEESKNIIKEAVNLDNVNEIFVEFVNYVGEENLVHEGQIEIYDILKEIQSPLDISLYVDKEPYIKTITDDKIINITGESGSGKSYYTNKYLNDDNYIVIDTDIIFSDKPIGNEDYLKIREIFKDTPKDILITDFDSCYLKILDYYKNSTKIIVIDSAQYRNIKDYSILRGKMIVMRTSISNCYERVLSRWKNNNSEYTKEEYDKYAERKKGMFKWYKGINKFLENIDKM